MLEVLRGRRQRIVVYLSPVGSIQGTDGRDSVKACRSRFMAVVSKMPKNMATELQVHIERILREHPNEDNRVDRSYVRRIVRDLRWGNAKIALGTADVQSTSANRFQVRPASDDND